MEGDWGGQIYLSIPFALLPDDITFEQIDFALEAIDAESWDCNEGDGRSWNILQDCGFFDDTDEGMADWQKTSMALPFHITPASMFNKEQQKLGGAVGHEAGGLLHDDKMWLHDEFVGKGLEKVNVIRALFCLAPLTSL